MAIRFIIGSSAANNRKRLLGEMLAKSSERTSEVFFFVPEQANLDAERDLCAMHEGGCVMNIDIVSFRRLAYRLVDELGDRIPPVLDEIGKSLLLEKVMTEHESEMPMFGGKVNKTGFVWEVKSLLSELVNFEVSAEELREAADRAASEDVMLARKLAEMSDVYRWFRDRCGENRIMEVDIYRAMIPLVRESQRLVGSTLYFDGYTGFTPTQISLLREMYRRCRDMVFTVTVDPAELAEGADRTPCFRISREMISSLRRMAEETGDFDVTYEVAEGEEPDEVCAPALVYLRKSLFRRRISSFAGDFSQAIHLRESSDRASEVKETVLDIVHSVRKEGCRYGEIGVVCGDVPTYAELLRRELTTAGVPFFIDTTSEVTDNALVDYLRSLLRMIGTDMRTDCVMRWLRNPLQSYDPDRLSYLENFLIARGIRGRSMWERGFAGDYGGKHTTDASRCIALAKEVWQSIRGVSEVLRDRTADVCTKTKALTAFLEEQGIAERTEAIAGALMKEDVPWHGRRSREYMSVYRAVMDLFERMCELMPSQEISLAEYTELCDAGFAEMRLGVIPPESDCIMIGDRKRSRIGRVKKLFFLGFNEGFVPGVPHGSILLNEREREILKNHCNLALSDTEKEALDTEEFYVFLTLQKPTESLTVSWSKSAEGGKMLGRSYILPRILRLFPKCEVEGGREASFADRVAANGGLAELMRNYAAASGKRTEDVADPEKLADYRALYRWYFEGESGGEAPVSPEMLARAENGFATELRISDEAASALHPAGTIYSVSRMQNYAECPYRHFLEYDLAVENRRTFEPSQLETGSAYHAMTEYIEARLSELREAGVTVTEEMLDALIAEAEETVLTDPANDCFDADFRSRYLMHSLANNLRFSVPHMVRRTNSGKYRFAGAEQEFSVSLGEGRLVGKIDRIELAKEDGTTYVKVVDFKSSGKRFNKDAVADGMDLQLPIYLRVKERELQAKGVRAVAAAGFYAPLSVTPVVGLPGEAGEAEVRQKVLPRGFYACEDSTCDKTTPLSEDRYLQQLDGAVEDGDYISDSVYLKAKGKSRTWDGISETEMKSLLDTAEKVIAQEAEQIAGGHIAVEPYTPKVCEYCDKAGICRKDCLARVPYRKTAGDGDGGDDE